MEPLTLYRTIVIDPPWKYGAWYPSSNAPPSSKPTPLPYAYMTIKQIKSLPIQMMAAADCELYMWTTQKYLPISFNVIDAWGFKYCQTLTWCKTPRGTGQGGVYCPTSEFLILARRGKMPDIKRIDSTWWEVRRQPRHSQKPEFFQDMIERVSYPPRLEMFARREREGWDVYGDQVNNSIKLDPYLGTNPYTPPATIPPKMIACVQLSLTNCF